MYADNFRFSDAQRYIRKDLLREQLKEENEALHDEVAEQIADILAGNPITQFSFIVWCLHCNGDKRIDGVFDSLYAELSDRERCDVDALIEEEKQASETEPPDYEEQLARRECAEYEQGKADARAYQLNRKMFGADVAESMQMQHEQNLYNSGEDY